MKKNTLLVAALFTCLLFACKKDSERGAPVAPFIFKGYFSNGDSLIIREGVNSGVNSYGRAGGIIDSNGTYFEIQSTFFTGSGSKMTLYLMETFVTEPDSSQREGMVHAGNYPFGRSILDSLADGVEITFADTSGREWNTSRGPQVGSFFTVTEQADNNFDIFTPYITTGNFRCILYDSLGNSITVDSASFKGRTVVYPTP